MKPRRLVLSLVAIAALLEAGVLSLAVCPAIARPQRNVDGPPPALQPPDLAAFAWLAGTWQGAWGPRTAQQAWTFPSSGLMSGTMEIAEHGKAYVTELFLISESATGVELRMRHFTAALAPWQGTEPAVMTYAGEDKDGLAFVNAADGQPSRLVFKRLDGEHYVLRSEVAPGQSKAQITEIVFHRVRQAPAVNHKSGF